MHNLQNGGQRVIQEKGGRKRKRYEPGRVSVNSFCEWENYWTSGECVRELITLETTNVHSQKYPRKKKQERKDVEQKSKASREQKNISKEKQKTREQTQENPASERQLTEIQVPANAGTAITENSAVNANENRNTAKIPTSVESPGKFRSHRKELQTPSVKGNQHVQEVLDKLSKLPPLKVMF